MAINCMGVSVVHSPSTLGGVGQRHCSNFLPTSCLKFLPHILAEFQKGSHLTNVSPFSLIRIRSLNRQISLPVKLHFLQLHDDFPNFPL